MRKLCMIELIFLLLFGVSAWRSVVDHQTYRFVQPPDPNPKVDFWAEVLYWGQEGAKNPWARLRDNTTKEVRDYTILWDNDHLTGSINIRDACYHSDEYVGITLNGKEIVKAVKWIPPKKPEDEPMVSKETTSNIFHYWLTYTCFAMVLTIRRARGVAALSFGSLPGLFFNAQFLPFWFHKLFLPKDVTLASIVIAPHLDDTKPALERFHNTTKRLENAIKSR